MGTDLFLAHRGSEWVNFVIPAKAGIQEPALNPSGAPASKNPLPQISPVRILLLDPFQLPDPVPLFYLLFPAYSGLHSLMQLVINPPMNPVSFREPLDPIVFVFPSTLGQVTRHANVKGPVSLAGKAIDRWPFRHPKSLDSRFRGNDE